ncbi:DUF3418 domain-containing protein, partial [Arthrobacter deserti]|nr:DUF3418 domain-containing protein [Arthrobacter deserti]
PGLRAELITALIKSLPKQVRKNFVPAPDVARAAALALAADFDPATDALEPSLELVLRRVKGHIIPPGSWNWGAVPPHLRMTFQVVDGRGKVLGEGKDLTRLQEELAPATRRAIAESLGATPETVKPAPKSGPRGVRAAERAAGTRTRLSAATGDRAEAMVLANGDVLAERSGLKGFAPPVLPRQVSRLVAGHTVTGYPAFVDEGAAVGLRIYQTPDEQESAMRSGVIRLLALRIPSPQRYVLEHLNNTEKLTFSQNPHGSVGSLIEDCTLAAI